MGFLDTIRSTLGLGSRIANDAGPPPTIQLGESSHERAPRPMMDPTGHVTDLPVWAQLQRIGGALTPTALSDIMREADQGYIARLVDVSNEARQKDCHLQCVMQTRECAVASLPWQIKPAGHGKRLRDRKIAEFVTDVFRADKNFPTYVSHLAGGNYHGHGVAENLWAKDAGKLIITGAKTIHARRFVYGLSDGKLRHYDTVGTTGPAAIYPGVDLQETWPGSFTVYQPRVTGDVQQREGLGRPLLWAALFRNWDMRDWVSLGEIAWKPWRRATYAVGSDQESIDNLSQILTRLTSTGVAVYPDSTKIEVDWPANPAAKSTHSELYSVLAGEMSKATLGQTLTTEAGDKGTQALGTVHDNVRKDILEWDATQIASCIQRDRIYWLVGLNFGFNEPLPILEFITRTPADLEKFGKGVSALAGAKLRMKADEIREKAGFSNPEEDDEVIGGSVDIPIDPKTGLPMDPEDAPPPAEAPKEPAKPEPATEPAAPKKAA